MYEKLGNLLKDAMKKAIDEQEVMGANFLVRRGNEEIVYCEEGLSDHEAGRKLNRDTIFRMYSMTKPVTSAAAMILLERGMLELYQPVADILPAFAKQKVCRDGQLMSPERPMFINDLLSMTSGLVYPDEQTIAGLAVGQVYAEAEKRLDSENPMSTLEFADRLAACPLAYTPGSSWQYGTSADVLGAVIEVVSGKKFSQFLEEEIFQPLGMNDTAFWVPEEKQERLATTYETVGQGQDKKMIRYEGNNLAIRNDRKKAPAYEAGGAGLVSTLDDYMKFARMLQNGGCGNGEQILHTKIVQFMTSQSLLPHQQVMMDQWIGLDGFTYGNLMRRCVIPEHHRNLCASGEYGWDGWLGMYFANFPNEDLTILMGTQKKDSGTFSLTRKLRNITLSELL